MKPKLLIAFLLATTFLTKTSFAQTQQEIIEKLSVVNMVLVDDQYMEIPKDSVLRKHVKIELLTEDEFMAKRKTRVNQMVVDTLKFKKKKGVLTLPFATRNRTFKDKITDGEDYTEYVYHGQIPALNAYVLETRLWEDVNYELLSKRNSSSQGIYSGMPLLSPDKKKIATAYADAYDTDCEIVLYKVVNGKVLNHIYVRFQNWMPGPDNLIFWGADGKLYLPYQYTENFWGEDGNYNTNYRYLRLSF